MGNIDFSKAPRGATHYQENKGDNFFAWFKSQDGINYCWCPGFDLNWVVLVDQNEMLDDCVKEIPKENKILIECKTEREQMLCEQVLRMCRGEYSEMQRYSGWYSLGGDTICIANNYRAKPKKELVVPWEWISDEYNSFTVRANNSMFAFNDNDQIHQVEVKGLKLDLTDIELPITVKRPSEK